MAEKLFTVTMKLNEPKKHSVRYDNHDNLSPIRSVYVNKISLPQNEWPEELIITVELPSNE